MFSAQQTERMIRRTGGVPVSYGGVVTWGHRDTADELFGEEEGGAGYKGTSDAVTVATGILSGLAMHAEIVVGGAVTDGVHSGGETLRIFDFSRVEDGGLTRITLGEQEEE